MLPKNKTPIIMIILGIYFAFFSNVSTEEYFGIPLNKLIGFSIIAVQVFVFFKIRKSQNN